MPMPFVSRPRPVREIKWTDWTHEGTTANGDVDIFRWLACTLGREGNWHFGFAIGGNFSTISVDFVTPTTLSMGWIHNNTYNKRSHIDFKKNPSLLQYFTLVLFTWKPGSCKLINR
jgi:hypothetical protein